MESTDGQQHLHWMLEAVAEAHVGLRARDGGPFGAVIVRNGSIVGRGHNTVTGTLDPTAHAEVNAIRDACRNLGSFQLTGCTVYTTCEPCPMCLGALYWARPDAVYFAAGRGDAAAAGFDDAFIYHQIPLPAKQRTIPFHQIAAAPALELFREWLDNPDKTLY